MKEIHTLGDNDWSHVHITQRTLSFGNSTYNLNSNLSIEITVPKYHFGEVKQTSWDEDGYVTDSDED